MKKVNRHIKYNLTLYFGTSDYLCQCLIVIFPSLRGRSYNPSFVQCRHAREGRQEGAGAPPAFQLGEQGSKSTLF